MVCLCVVACSEVVVVVVVVFMTVSILSLRVIHLMAICLSVVVLLSRCFAVCWVALFVLHWNLCFPMVRVFFLSCHPRLCFSIR